MQLSLAALIAYWILYMSMLPIDHDAPGGARTANAA